MNLSQKELLHERLQEQGRVIRALDGLQPDVGHEVLRVILEVLSGEALLLRALLSSAQEDLVVMLGEENDTLPESVEVGGITSDGQLSLPRAVANVFADVPLSLFVRSRPADLRGRSSRKKKLKKWVRGIRPIERGLSFQTDEDAQAARDYCLAVCRALTDYGYPSLCTSGLRLHERLSQINHSIDRVGPKKAVPRHLERLQRLLKKGLCATERYRSPLKQVYGWVHQLAQVLLMRLQEQAAQLGTVWQQAIAHVFKVIANYEPHLFFCYQIPDVLRTNNDLEQSFGQVRAHERGALPRLVVQGTARMRAAFATRLHVFTPGKLVPHDVQSWGQLCAQISIGRRLVANNGAFAKARLPIWPPMRLNSSRRVYDSRKIWRKVRSMLRRDFLKLARNASVFAAIAGSSGFGLPRQAKYATIDLDWVENYVVKLRARFEQGNTYYVLEESLRCYNTLKRALIPESDARAAELQMRLGLLHAKAQDAALPWYERAHPAICTYNLVEEEILRKYPLKAFPFYRAYLLAQRAPLYREIGQLEKSVEQFTRALNTYVRESGDSALHVELYYSRAHAWVVQGNIQNWLRDLDAARAVAQAAEEEHRKQLLGLVTYTQGEGYKRLAYSDRLDLSAYQRAQYAAKGLECFEQTRFVSEKRWAAHALIHGVAEAQCLVRLEPNEAIRRCEVLRVQAQQAYPSIIQKIDRTIGAARQYLNRRRREVG